MLNAIPNYQALFLVLMEKQTITLRILKLGILLSFLFCYLEWGKGNSEFIFQIEYEVFAKHASAESFFHPLILLPFAGQLFLIVSICISSSGKKLTITGIALLSSLVLMVILVGSLSLNYKILLSAFPFVLFSAIYIYIIKNIKS